jgi:hypothetical protein
MKTDGVRNWYQSIHYDCWCSLGPGKGHLPARQFIKMDGLIPVSTHLCFHLTVPLTSNLWAGGNRPAWSGSHSKHGNYGIWRHDNYY